MKKDKGSETNHKFWLWKLDGTPDSLRHLLLDPVLLNSLPFLLRLQFVCCVFQFELMSSMACGIYSRFCTSSINDHARLPRDAWPFQPAVELAHLEHIHVKTCKLCGGLLAQHSLCLIVELGGCFSWEAA